MGIRKFFVVFLFVLIECLTMPIEQDEFRESFEPPLNAPQISPNLVLPRNSPDIEEFDSRRIEPRDNDYVVIKSVGAQEEPHQIVETRNVGELDQGQNMLPSNTRMKLSPQKAPVVETWNREYGDEVESDVDSSQVEPFVRKDDKYGRDLPVEADCGHVPKIKRKFVPRINVVRFTNDQISRQARHNNVIDNVRRNMNRRNTEDLEENQSNDSAAAAAKHDTVRTPTPKRSSESDDYETETVPPEYLAPADYGQSPAMNSADLQSPNMPNSAQQQVANSPVIPSPDQQSLGQLPNGIPPASPPENLPGLGQSPNGNPPESAPENLPGLGQSPNGNRPESPPEKLPGLGQSPNGNPQESPPEKLPGLGQSPNGNPQESPPEKLPGLGQSPNGIPPASPPDNLESQGQSPIGNAPAPPPGNPPNPGQIPALNSPVPQSQPNIPPVNLPPNESAVRSPLLRKTVESSNRIQRSHQADFDKWRRYRKRYIGSETRINRNSRQKDPNSAHISKFDTRNAFGRKRGSSKVIRDLDVVGNFDSRDGLNYDNSYDYPMNSRARDVRLKRYG